MASWQVHLLDSSDSTGDRWSQSVPPFSHSCCLWPERALCKGLCVVHGAPTKVQCCPKECQCQIHNVRKNIITFPWIRKIIIWRIYRRTSTLLEYTVSIFIGLCMCQGPCQSIVFHFLCHQNTIRNNFQQLGKHLCLLCPNRFTFKCNSQRNYFYIMMIINSVTVMIRQWSKLLWLHFLGWNTFPSLFSCLRRDGKDCFFILCVPQHTTSALNCGKENISKTHSILHFIPQTHQKTASSFCKLHFPRETATSPKPVSTNKCGAQTCLLIEKADGSIADGTAVRSDCGKQSIRGEQGSPFLPLRLGDRVWGWNPQDSNRNHHCCLSETQRQTNSQEQVVLGFRGECCLSTSSSLLCLSSAVSLIVLGMKPRPFWPEISNAKRYWGNSWLKHNI